MRVLNIGCGDSKVGTNRIDISKNSQATELALATKLPYKEGSFNYILAENIIEHQPNPLEFLLECKRVLCNGGYLVIVTDNYGYRGWFSILRKFRDWHGLYSNPNTDKDKHYMIFGVNHLENLMRIARFFIIDSELFTRWEPSFIQKCWILINPNLGHSHIVMSVRK